MMKSSVEVKTIIEDLDEVMRIYARLQTLEF